jgi:hypothetical protein
MIGMGLSMMMESALLYQDGLDAFLTVSADSLYLFDLSGSYGGGGGGDDVLTEGGRDYHRPLR